MAQAARSVLAPSNREALIHSARTTVGAVLSWYLARLFKQPEPYWATITAMVVTQSTLGAAMTVSEQRFAGTVIGAVVGGVLASYFPHSLLAFGAAVFVMGVLCALVRLDQSAYRFAGITLAIVELIPTERPPWSVASHRAIEVSIGIVVALLLYAIWPSKPETPPGTGQSTAAR